jgi:hypothetical protein
MKKNGTFLFFVMFSVLFILSASGCIESRIKEIYTDASGNCDESVAITQSAKLAFSDYNVGKLNCGSNVKILITISNKDIAKDNFMIADKGQMIPNIKPVSVKSGDRIKIKITDGCPNTKYVINFTLDSDTD